MLQGGVPAHLNDVGVNQYHLHHVPEEHGGPLPAEEANGEPTCSVLVTQVHSPHHLVVELRDGCS